MKRVLFTTLALWVLLLSPMLCIAGVLEHLCSDCPVGVICEHEEDCSADPCSDDLLFLGSSSTVAGQAVMADPAVIAVLDSSLLASATVLRNPEPLPRTSLFSARDNLSLLQSDIPLLS